MRGLRPVAVLSLSVVAFAAAIAVERKENLIEALADSRLEMRAAALRALEKLEAKECRPPLRQIEDGCTIAVNP